MKIKYEFITGEIMEVEVDDEIALVILNSRKKEASYERKMRRWCYSLDAADDKSCWLMDKGEDESDAAKQRYAEIENFKRQMASLTNRQKELLKALFIDGMTQQEYAQKMGINQSNVSRQLRTICKRLRKGK